MELATFIRDAMAQLARGVQLANEAVRGQAKGGTMNFVTMPAGEQGQKSGWVDFDVAVQPVREGVVEVLRAEAGRSVSPATVSRMAFTLKVAFILS